MSRKTLKTIATLAAVLATAAVVPATSAANNDARAADREIAELQAVRAADVQRVLRRQVLGAQRVSVTYTQEKTS